MRISQIALLPLLLLASSLKAEVTQIPAEQTGVFSSVNTVMIKATPAEVYSAMTGDISGWWDHSWSEHPYKFYIEGKPGGGFYELFDEAGNGVLHATVIAAVPGKMLRLDGPLGLAGRAVKVVTTYEYEASGDSTKVTITCNMSGQIDMEWAQLVDKVQRHFIEERLKVYMENGGKMPE